MGCRPTAWAALAALACFLASLDGDFVHDDVPAVRDNPDVQGTAPLSQLWINDFWGRPMSHPASHKSYRPVTVLSFRWTVAFAGGSPRTFHAVNIALHAAVTWLLVVACRNVLRWPDPDCLLAGLLFATHPVHAEAVASIVGRAELLSALFFLLSFFCFARWASGGPAGWFVGCALGAGLALLAKEQGVTVLPVCAALQLARTRSPASVGRAAALLALFAALSQARLWMLHGQLPVFSPHDNPAAFSDSLLTRSLTYWYLAAFNAGLLLWPTTLSYDWQLPLVESLWDSRNLLTAGLVAGVGLLAWRTKAFKRTERVLALSLLIIPFLPASNLAVTVGFVVAERVLYLPSMGYCLLVTGGIARLRPLYPRLCKLATCFLLVSFSVRAVRRSHDWLSRETLFSSGLRSSPHNAKVHYNYANLQKDLGNLELSRHHYRMALRLWPDYASAHNNLGTVVGDPREAERHFLRALEISPGHSRALYNLGNLYSKNESRQAEAGRLLRQALLSDPEGLPEAYSSLAGVYQAQGLSHLAEWAHHHVLRLDPLSADAHNNYGTFLQKAGRTAEALLHYERALELHPNHSVALANAAMALKDGHRAAIYMERALELSPSPVLADTLGLLYLRLGRLDDAADLYRRLISDHPQYIEARLHFAQVLSAQRELYQAENVLLELLRNRTSLGAFHQLSVVYARMNRTTEALDAIAGALELCPTAEPQCGRLHSHHADLLKDLRDYSSAAESYRLALELDPSLSHAYLNLAVIEHLQGQFQAARAHYLAAERLDPTNPVVRENLAKLQRSCCMFR